MTVLRDRQRKKRDMFNQISNLFEILTLFGQSLAGRAPSW